ncbi:MAG: hypothetical protein ACEQSL_00690 [Sediminibacterium sp.]
MSVTVPKKDPATDSWHLITVSIGGTAQDPSTWDAHIVHVYRENGDVIAQFTDGSIDEYELSEVVDDGGTMKIKFLLKSASHNTLANERLYVKVFQQQDVDGYKAKFGPSLENKPDNVYPLIDLGRAEKKILPDVGGSSS